MNASDRLQGLLFTLLCVSTLAVGLGGCGPQQSSSSTQKTDSTAGSATKAGLTTKRDLSTFDVCALVPAAEAAAVLGASPDRISVDTTMGSYATDCTYTVARGEGMNDYVILWLYPPEMWALSMDGEKIAGLGTEAYLTSGASGGYHSVNVLVTGDFMLEARAGSAAHARGLAELALERLAGDAG